MASAGLGAAYRQLRGLFGGRSVVGLEDGQLLSRYATDRDEAAFEALIERHGPMVLTLCRAILKNEHDSEDAFQATFLVLARKAGSIRGGESLGGWLHRVAYRASIQASIDASKRRRKEAEAQAMANPIAPSSQADPELQALLHAEINRLPESQRLPVVLCDLEGLTYDQAASQLRWTVPTLRNRLARARQRLKARLTRRGVMPSALVALTTPRASAAVPPGLVKLTLAAATGGATSTTAALLAQTLMKGTFMTQLKIAASLVVAAVVVASAGVIVAGVSKIPNEPKPLMRRETQAEVAVLEPQKSGEPIEVRGIVVAPDGKPVTGATVRGDIVWPHPAPEAKTDAAGRFAIKLTPHNPLAPAWPKDRERTMIATAPGFGLGSIKIPSQPHPNQEVTIKLIEDGLPIEGRVVDSVNKPVAGARVKVEVVWAPDGSPNLDAWVAKVTQQEQPRSVWQDLTGTMTPIEVATDSDGRFRLAGLGRERVVEMTISGPTIATSQAYAVTRDMKDIQRVVMGFGGTRTFVYHAPKFDYVAAAGRVVEGVVRDKDTGKPIEGLRIEGAAFNPRSKIPDREVEARTDAAGRYRLTGLGVAKSYRIFARPYLAQPNVIPYTPAELRATSDAPTDQPIGFDFSLKRGVVVRGKITDKATGLPVPGYVNAFAFHDNPLIRDFPGYTEGRTAWAHNRPDGSFEVVTIPGRGIIACRADVGRYRGGVGAEAIAGIDPKFHSFDTVPEDCSPFNYHTMTEVNLDPKAESATLDIQVDPGHSVKLDVVDPDGQPLADLRAEGIGDLFRHLPLREPTSTVEVGGLDPSQPRRVTVFHDGRKLVGSVWLKGSEVGPLTLKLQPWGTVVGRIIDERADRTRPLALSAGSNTPPTKLEEVGIFPEGTIGGGIPADKDGRFRIEGLVPGLKYAATALEFREITIGDLFKDVTIQPGETRDLGDLKVLPLER